MLNFDFRQIEHAQDAEIVTSAHFGGVYSTFYGLSAFHEQAVALGVKDIRWPGGTRGEHAYDSADKDGDGITDEYIYDLNHNNLMTIEGKGLTDAIAEANAIGGSLSIFLPSIRYFGNEVAAAADAGAFMDKLLAGYFGTLPSKLVIELGNESLDGTVATAVDYGRIANAQLSAIRTSLDALGLTADDFGFSVAIQIGRSIDEDVAIRSQIETDNLSEIDALIAHHLPVNVYNHNRILDGDGDDAGDNRFTRSLDYVDDWSRAVAKARKSAIDTLDLIVSAWTVGPSSDVSDDLLMYQDIGARQGRTTIDTFANLLGIGADAASLWGIDARANPNWFSQDSATGVELSHGGIVFQMMAESLQGMTLLEGYSQNWAMTGATEAPIAVYGFEDSQKYVLFVVANDVTEATSATLTFDDLDLSRKVEVMHLTTTLDAEGAAFEGTDRARLYETPVVSEFAFDIDEGEFDFTVIDDYEVNRLTIWKADAAESPVWNPLDVANVLVSDGGITRSIVQTLDDVWSIRGTAADEKIFDNFGDDLLEGGGGSDVFIFRPDGGANVVFDFEQNGEVETFDRLLLKGFGYNSVEAAVEHLTLTDDGLLFSDQGTSVLFDGFYGDAADMFAQ